MCYRQFVCIWHSDAKAFPSPNNMVLSQKGKTLLNGFIILIKQAQGICTLHHVRTQQRCVPQTPFDQYLDLGLVSIQNHEE